MPVGCFAPAPGKLHIRSLDCNIMWSAVGFIKHRNEMGWGHPMYLQALESYRVLVATNHSKEAMLIEGKVAALKANRQNSSIPVAFDQSEVTVAQ